MAETREGRMPPYRVVLDRLDRGDRPGALAALEAPGTDDPTAGESGPPTRILQLLRALLTQAPIRISAANAEQEPPPGQHEESRLLVTLERAGSATLALREGRVEDLVTDAAAAAAASVPSRPWITLYIGSLLQGAFRFTGDPMLRDRALEQLSQVADRIEHPHLAISARALMGTVHLMGGSYHAALDACASAIALADASGLASGPAVALAHQFRGYVLFEWNRLQEAEDALARAWELAGPNGRGVRSGVARVRAAVATARADGAAAERWLDELERIVAEPMTLRNREWLAAVRVRARLGSGDLGALADWLRTYDYRPEELARSESRALAARLHELEHLLAVLEGLGDWEALLATAPHLLRASGSLRHWYAVRALSAEAVALHALGRYGEAETRWSEALTRGARGSFVRVYLEGDPRRLDLLHDAAHGTGAAVAQARRVHAATDPAPDPSALPPLSERQRLVLSSLARGCSNKAIARELGLSLSTVKTHLRALFVKLDASSRTQALAHARRRGLL